MSMTLLRLFAIRLSRWWIISKEISTSHSTSLTPTRIIALQAWAFTGRVAAGPDGRQAGGPE